MNKVLLLTKIMLKNAGSSLGSKKGKRMEDPPDPSGDRGRPDSVNGGFGRLCSRSV